MNPRAKLQPRITPHRPGLYRSDATGLAYWLRYALGEPRDFAYCAPRRIACRLLGRHNATCRGRTDHPRSR
ncbi:hypothetical protein [Streptomyces sp. NPDC047070]|uniref:hypothetical protein n=1 Tax=Streptomyces sp. NPDC047070 TaxID=3154923 RepID=UPI0034543AF6